MAKYKIIYSIFFLTVLVGCDPVDLNMKIKNSKKNDIYCRVYTYSPEEIYNPKEIYNSAKNETQNDCLLKKDSSKTIPKFSHWDMDERVYCYVFNADSINRYDFKKIKNDSSYQIIFMKVKDIAENNWILEIR